MRYRYFASVVLLCVLPVSACPLAASGNTKHEKTVWNYDGGVILQTDGSLPEGPCFRLSGKLTDPDFFENFKREDSVSGTVYRRGNDVVTEFPEHLHLAFQMFDMPCDNHLQSIGSRVYLNRALMSKLHLNFYWKRGTELRPAAGVTTKNFEIRRIPHYADDTVKDIPEKYEWWFEFDVPSAGVPITDSLVIIVRSSDNRIAARVAARL